MDPPTTRIYTYCHTLSLHDALPLFPLLGDRRDHFSAEKDIWEMVTRIAAGRKAREIDPAEAALKVCVARAADDPHLSGDAKARLADMLDFVPTMGRWHDELLSRPKPETGSEPGRERGCQYV